MCYDFAGFKNLPFSPFKFTWLNREDIQGFGEGPGWQQPGTGFAGVGAAHLVSITRGQTLSFLHWDVCQKREYFKVVVFYFYSTVG